MKNNTKGYIFLNRLNLRRDRFNILIWALALAGLMAGVAFKFEGIYGTPQSIASIQTTLHSPAMKALFGSFDTALNKSSDVFATEMLIFMAIVMIAMNIYFAVRITRGEEDKGLTELISAHAIGRGANFYAATTELILINLTLGILYSVGIQFSGMAGVTAQGSWLIGLGLGAMGLLFGMVGMLMAQLFDNSRSATIMSYFIFGIMYVARMYTDIKNPDQTWWVPLGWIEKIDAFHGNNWLPVLLMVLLSVVLWGLALLYNRTRDIGSGLITVQFGKQRASWLLRGPITLVERLQRHSTIIWIVALFILGTTYGSIFDTIGNILKTNPTMQQVFGKAAVQSANHQILLNFVSVISVVMAALASLPALIAVNKLRGDNNRGYLESVYAKALSRTHIFSGYLLNSIVVGIVSFAASLLGLYLAGNAVLTHGDLSLNTYVHTFVAVAPTITIAIGVAALLNGLAPRLNWISWIYLGYGFFASYLGKLIKMPDWSTKLNGLGWTNEVPLHSVNYTNVSVMLLITLGLIIIGAWGYRRRDLD